MNTVIPFIEDLSSISSIQSAVIWIAIVALSVFVITFVLSAIRKPRDLKFLTRLFVGFGAVLLPASLGLWIAIDLVGEMSEWKQVEARTIEQIEKNLDVKLTFTETSKHRLACSADLDNTVVDAVTVEHDSNKYLVSLAASKNDDGTCTYELIQYKDADLLFDAVSER